MSSSAARRMGDTTRHHFLIMDRNPIEWSAIGFYAMGWIGIGLEFVLDRNGLDWIRLEWNGMDLMGWDGMKCN